MDNVIEAKAIQKVFGTSVALDNISFSVKRGEIFGFLGPSGSGKTTTISILTGQLVPDVGDSTLLGENSQALTSQELQRLGLVSDTSGFYEKMTLYNNLLFYGKYYGISQSTIDDLLKRVGLYDSRKKVAEKLSTGMRQRMFLARALINRPEVLFLDEPTSGLDPSTTRMIHELLLELKESGTTIFLTTHDMHEATILCDRLALLNNGRLVEEGRPRELIQKYNQEKKVKLIYQDNSEEILAFEKLANIMKDKESEVIAIHSCEPTLEDIFIQLTGGKLNV